MIKLIFAIILVGVIAVAVTNCSDETKDKGKAFATSVVSDATIAAKEKASEAAEATKEIVKEGVAKAATKVQESVK